MHHTVLTGGSRFGRVELFMSAGKSPEDTERKGNTMGKKDGKPEPNDVGSNMKIKISKETAK